MAMKRIPKRCRVQRLMDRRRRQLGYTRREWAEMSNLTPRNLCLWMRGEYGVTLNTLNRLAETLKLDIVLVPQEMREQVQALGKKR